MLGVENTVQVQLDLNRTLTWIFSIAGILGNVYLLAFKLTLFKLLPRKIHPQHYRTYDTFLRIPQIFMINLCIANLFGAIYLFIMANADLYLQKNYAVSYSSLTQLSFNTSSNATSSIAQLINSTCTVARFFSIISLTVSVLIALVMAIDRSICIYYPQCKKRITFKTAHILMLCCWLMGSAMTIAYCTRFLILMDGHRNPIGHILQSLCFIGHHTDQILKIIIWIILALLLLIFLVVTLLYVIIFIRSAPAHQHLRRRQYEMRIVWLTSCMMLIQILSWLPGLVALIGDLLSLPFITTTKWQYTSSIMLIFFYLSPAVDPIIYIFFAKKYSKKSADVCHCCCCLLITKVAINKAESIRSNNSTTVTTVEFRRTHYSYHG